MSDPVLPAYGRRSLVEVLPALLAALGLPGPVGELAVPDARAAVLLLVDGLGHDLLRAHAADAPFLASARDAGPITAGFPSSTAVSLASLGTGQPPGVHGLVGTSVRVGDELLDALRWTIHRPGGADLRERLVPEQVQAEPTVFERATAAGIATTVVTQRAVRNSGLTRATLRGARFRGTSALGDLAAELITTARSPGRQLVYGYHGDLDGVGHVHGPGSLPWRLQLAAIDRVAARIAEALPDDAVLAITGDHGMVAIDRRHDADIDDDLRRGVLDAAGDVRARHFHAQPGAAADVLATWQARLGDDAWVVSREQAVAEDWFGPLRPSVADRVGDVVVAARGSAGVIRSAAEPVISRLPGQHGSLSAAEQLVPMLLHGG